MASLSRFLHETTTFLVENFGLGGLFVIALLDSSFLSLPEVNDILVVTLSLADRDRFWLYALVAALGSTTGCAALHALGKNGGQAILQRRVSAARIAKLQATFRRFDLFAVLVPSLLPPPCPFKVFVLASGVFGMSYARFLVTVMVGRSVRYLSAAWLALRYGQTFLVHARAYAYELALSAVAVLLLVWLIKRTSLRHRALDPARGERT
jgi:membrane protein YqaA with SNARE-associated domain